uniref:Uncharacterized protein n=1 Tax=Meloidogyne enterolobii TaxID=390850 RepID=A0A6V7WM36_MELEN|nr:unnamed protein product [Meloidogyne enterolobii]
MKEIQRGIRGAETLQSNPEQQYGWQVMQYPYDQTNQSYHDPNYGN